MQFALPSTESQTFKGKTEVVWTDAHAVGLRFLRVAPECRSNFAAWRRNCNSTSQPNPAIRLEKSSEAVAARLGISLAFLTFLSGEFFASQFYMLLLRVTDNQELKAAIVSALVADASTQFQNVR